MSQWRKRTFRRSTPMHRAAVRRSIRRTPPSTFRSTARSASSGKIPRGGFFRKKSDNIKSPDELLAGGSAAETKSAAPVSPAAAPSAPVKPVTVEADDFDLPPFDTTPSASAPVVPGTRTCDAHAVCRAHAERAERTPSPQPQQQRRFPPC